MTIDTKRLRELAAKATPAPWHAEPFARAGDSPPMWRGRVFFLGADNPKTNTRDCDLTVADARYIAAVSPGVVVALLDEIERLFKDWGNDSRAKYETASALIRERDSLRAQLLAALAAKDELADIALRAVMNAGAIENQPERIRDVARLKKAGR